MKHSTAPPRRYCAGYCATFAEKGKEWARYYCATSLFLRRRAVVNPGFRDSVGREKMTTAPLLRHSTARGNAGQVQRPACLALSPVRREF